jgi:YegS/Rv2252/BmrU family lipid kinase
LKGESNNRWYIIVNPEAGSKKTQADWPGIKKLLEAHDFDMECVTTKYQNHATELAKNAIQDLGFSNIISVGGDGTLNEVINGVFLQDRLKPTDVTVGVISVGTGNDWIRMYNIPQDYNEQIKVIKKNNTFLQDVGEVSYFHNDAEKVHYFINIAGMGFDAFLAKKTNVAKQKGSGGAFTYLYNLVLGLFQFSYNYIEIDKEGENIFSGNVFSMSIGICKYHGAGIMQLPFAIPDDGLFDVTVIEKASRLTIVRNIKNLYDGSFVKMKEVKTYTGEQFTIRAIPQKSVFLETDGETLGHSPLFFKILPRAAKFIIK